MLFGRQGRRPKQGGKSQSRTTGAEGHPVCTSEARARKIGEAAAQVARPDPLQAHGGTPPAFTCQNAAAPSGIRFKADRPPHQGREGRQRPSIEDRARKHAVAGGEVQF
jgi:hypothetical protein